MRREPCQHPLQPSNASPGHSWLSWTLAACLTSLVLVPTAGAQQAVIFAEEPSRRAKAAGPTPAPVDASRPPRVSADLKRRSDQSVTPEMLDLARRIADRLAAHVGSASSFSAKQKAIRNFRLTSEEKKQGTVLGFASVTIEAGGGGNSPYLVGGSLTQGVAFSLIPGHKPRVINSGGFSLGVPGAQGDLRVGLWKSAVDQIASWSMGVNASAVTGKGVGIGVGVFWNFDEPPRFEGFNIGPAFGKASVGADAGLAWTEYTGQILNTAEDTFRVLTLRETRHGAAIGERCKVGPDCKGYNAPVGSRNAGTACCGGVCKRTKKDYVGVSWCPSVCKKSLFAAAGSC